MENGWVKLHRKSLENPLIRKPQYFTLWCVLLLLANHKSNKFMWNKDIIIVKEGQFITGRKQLNEITGIPESTIEDILAFLESQGQIQQQKTTKFRLITIINWKEYQNSDNKATTKQQQADTNKNDNNDKNEKNNTLPPVGGEMIKTNSSNEVKELFDVFHLKGILQNYANKTHRQCAKDLIAKYGLDGAKRLAEYAISILGQEYAPTINNPYELKSKLASLNSHIKKQKNKKINYIKL